ncbi:PQQ-binding-like beta-propeller repeat protein [Actinoplanes sp. N902-109]|uniref:outer membrane protein assembly factor BamB family protein n=1 Tax=Actinoplanes sp. (strain N902-109) TaxID=649831 RepID=UPI000329491E|nr:PQQ-binding-like beta-propeller repeat protein [Actinoplanes sp. N902-109]AGL20587.1 hypothetical protein L083_7077 [Actinoplanes sp. N902-109]
MGVIDLGVVTPYEPSEPGRPRLRLIAAVLAVLSLMALTGSAPPRSHALSTLWTIPVNGNEDSFTLTPDGVYVLSSLGARRITAYEPRTGRIRWTRLRPDDTSWIGVVDSGVLVAPAIDDDTTQNIAIDTGTGRQLWRRPGDAVAISAGRVLLTVGDAEGPSIRRLDVVDLHTGTVVWSHPADRRRTWVATGGEHPDRIAVVTADGQVTVHDFGTGRVLAARQLPLAAGTQHPDEPSGIGVAGHSLVLPGPDGDLSTVRLFDLTTLRERWQVSSPSLSGFYECGPVLCLNDANGLTGYDADTGRVLWRRPGDGYAASLGRDRLVIETGSEGARRVLADARTGRELTDLGTGSLGYGYDSDGPFYALFLTRDPPGRTAVGELDEHTGAIELRGALDPSADYCQSAGDLLACITGGGRLTVTAVGPSRYAA